MYKFIIAFSAAWIAFSPIAGSFEATAQGVGGGTYDVLVKIPCNAKPFSKNDHGGANFTVLCEYGKDAFYESFEGTGNSDSDLDKARSVVNKLDLKKMFYGDNTFHRYTDNSGANLTVEIGASFISKDIIREGDVDECLAYNVYVVDVDHTVVETLIQR